MWSGVSGLAWVRHLVWQRQWCRYGRQDCVLCGSCPGYWLLLCECTALQACNDDVPALFQEVLSVWSVLWLENMVQARCCTGRYEDGVGS